MPPRRTIGQVWLIIRRLRANSPASDGTIFSLARALGHVHRAQAALDHVERERQVVAHDRVDDQVGVAPGGVDRAVAAGDRAQARLERAHGQLVAPVEALLVGAACPSSATRRWRTRPARSGPGRRRSRRAGRRTRAPAPAAASGSHSALASEKATISPRARCTAASCARILPPRGSSSTRSAPASPRARGGRVRCSRRRRRSPRAARADSRARARWRPSPRSPPARRGRRRSATEGRRGGDDRWLRAGGFQSAARVRRATVPGRASTRASRPSATA